MPPEELSNQMDSVTTTSGNIDLGDWQALVILIPYIVVPVLLLIGVILAWLSVDVPKVRCLLKWLVFPIFIFLVIFSYSLASGILIGGQWQCRFLFGWQGLSPDQTVMEIFYELGYSDDDLIVKIVRYYVSNT
jgi:ABC-type transport system involved in cytochrome c biogenesis permease component